MAHFSTVTDNELLLFTFIIWFIASDYPGEATRQGTHGAENCREHGSL